MRAQPYERYPATCVRLLKWIRAFAETNTSDRLPSEENIAGQLGVSRVKIRDVLSQLEAAGYVTRKRGVGTLINRYVLAEAAGWILTPRMSISSPAAAIRLGRRCAS